MSCSYCRPENETVLWRGSKCRVILAHEPGFDGWCRVVWNDHVRELSDLDDADREHLMRIVAAVERALVAELHPHKMNLAALGTAAPHLHFHVIPRFQTDATFPEPVWTARRHAATQLAADQVVERMRAALRDLPNG